MTRQVALCSILCLSWWVTAWIPSSNTRRPRSSSPSSSLLHSVDPAQEESSQPQRSWLRQWWDQQQPSGVLTRDMQALIQRNTALPSKNFVVVITGATGGIGSGLTNAVLKLGGQIIAMDRNLETLQAWRNTTLYPDQVQVVAADFGTLDSVTQASQQILDVLDESGQTIDILVNNAGIHYGFSDDDLERLAKCRTAQDHDLLFQVNYLSHFLLTEQLLPKLKQGRVVQIASGFSWGADGSGLVPEGNLPPAASRIEDRIDRHVSSAYSNSKLAQIWHAVQLSQRGLVDCAVSACPSWAATGIAGEDADGTAALEFFAFPTRPQNEDECAGPALRSILNAMFLPKEELHPGIADGTKFVGNANLFDILFPKSNGKNSWVWSRTPLARVDVATRLAVFLVMPLQRFFHQELYFQDISDECSNVTGQEALYEWSQQAVADWTWQVPPSVSLDDETDEQEETAVVAAAG